MDYTGTRSGQVHLSMAVLAAQWVVRVYREYISECLIMSADKAGWGNWDLHAQFLSFPKTHG